MDKSWIDLPTRMSVEYWNGIDRFLEFAYVGWAEGSMINCPCRRCQNRYYLSRSVVRDHLIDHGFLKKYKNWTNHGEPYDGLHDMEENESVTDSGIGDCMVEMIQEAIGIPNVGTSVNNDEAVLNDPGTGPNEETAQYFKLLEDAQHELFPGCQKFTVLSFIVRLLHMKVLCGWSDKSLTMCLELLNEAFPEGVKLPTSYYHARKITEDLGFTYKTWDACPNNCMWFRDEDVAHLDICVICGTSRYKQDIGIATSDMRSGKRVAAKQVRYFPLKPRLQRLFMPSKTSKLMRWHAEDRTNDGVFRHPADSLAWKDFDQRNSDFASDIRNVRLGLASDGFNPFRMMNIVHSTWPVILIPYNLPPWMCMKQPFLIMSMLIDGPKGPGDKINVYMQPLIEELKELWEEGVQTFDASSKQMFQLHAALLWTISDFPAYAHLSGWSTKGKFACPCCNSKTQSLWLTHGRKHAYLGNRRFLPSNHKFRKDTVSFVDKDHKREWRGKPKILSGTELLLHMESEGILTDYKRDDIKERYRVGEVAMDENRTHNWKKKSIFFELPYWKHNLIRHNLDVMHIEKNFCDNILWTILGTARSKDNLNARLDLKVLQIRKALQPEPIKGSNKVYLNPAQFAMSKDEKDRFIKVLKGVRAPDGYASNISRRVRLEDRSILGLKSHDNHVLLQQLIPLAVRNSLSKNVVEALIEVSIFFRQLCSKVNRASDLEYIQDRLAITLCRLEKIFPPAFFDIMEHLPIHLADEALIAGTVQFRWMYPIERYLLTLKQYVRNRAHPEASIANGYLMEECLNFCAQYLHDVETKSNRPFRHDDGGENIGRVVGKGNKIILDDVSIIQAHRYVLFNSDSVAPFRIQHLEVLKSKMPRADHHQIQRAHFESFHTWFMEQVQTLRRTDNATFSEEVNNLANGPQNVARRFKSYNINGYHFRVKDLDDCRTTQNSGVALKADTMSYASRRDRNPRLGAVYYYGKLTDIVEIRYTNDLKFILFKCDWIDNNVGKKEDLFKFTLVNFNNLLYRDNRLNNEPFILASQAEQVWYVSDSLEPGWQVVVKMSPRGLVDMPSNDSQAEPFMSQQMNEVAMIRDEDVDWVRVGIDGEAVDL